MNTHPPSHDESADALGKIGAYRLLSSLGKGGMGEVFKAHDERLKRHVAIKRIRAERSFDAAARSRFRREAQAVAQLSHPAIIQIFDVLETRDGDCIVMEYVEGQSLSSLMAAKELTPRLAVQIAAAMASGLSHAHERGLIHRDLKPENVMLTEAPGGFGLPVHVKILDFGLARALTGEVSEGMGGTLTEPGAVVGTAHAMSPEQAMGQPVDHLTDLFALGAILYEMLSSTSAFRGKNWIDTLNRVLHEDPPWLDAEALGIPEELASLTMALIEKERYERPQKTAEVAATLRRLDAEMGGEPAPVAIDSLADRQPSPDGIPLKAQETALSSPALSVIAQVRTLVRAELLGGPRLVEELGDTKGAEAYARHDRAARDLVSARHGLEVEKASGFLILFERPIDGVNFALDYHRAVAELAEEIGVEVRSRTAVHLGEVMVRNNSSDDVARGAKPTEIDGHAKTLVALLLTLAGPRQTLMTRGTFDLARRAAQDEPRPGEPLFWMAHGKYVFRDLEEPVDVFEVGAEGFAPLDAPEGSKRALRSVAVGDEMVLGWRPAVGLPIRKHPNWTLVERVGEGGFGEVWLARHKSQEKRVFKFCFDSGRLRSLKREVTLFRLLKQSLGNRDDIARIIDWNFEEAPYYLAAEYTEGGSLVTWCEEAGGVADVATETRLELIAQVAVALSAAHSVGVLHKDVKPDNVLVTTDAEGAPRIRLTDFGIGLLTDDTQLHGRFFTIQGMTGTESTDGEGTRMYMAPELLEGKPPSVQADIYSLGVMLYQVVVGDFQRALAPGWRRDIDDELLADDIAYFVDGRPDRRAESALEVAKRLRSLGERREQRLAEEEERREAHLARRALLRAQRRRRLATAVASATLIILGLVLVFAFREREARRNASREAQTSQRVTELFVDIFAASDPFRATGDGVTLREVLDSGTERVRAELSDEPEVQATLMHTMGDVYRSLGLFDISIPLLEEAIEARRLSLAPDHPLVAESLQILGESQCRSGQFDQGEKSLQEALEIRRGISERTLAVGETLEALGHLCLQFRGEYDGAEAALKEALDIHRQHLATQDPEVAENEHRLALVIARQGRLAESVDLLKKSLESKRRNVGRHPDVARVLINLAHVMWWQEAEGAEPLAQEAVDIVKEKLAEAHPLTAVSHQILAGVLHAAGKLDASEAAYLEALAIRERLGDRSFRRADTLFSLAWLLIEKGEYGAAEAHVDEALTLYREGEVTERPPAFFAKAVKGACLAERGDRAAEANLLEAYDFLKDAGAASAPYRRATLRWLVAYYEEFGSAEQAADYRRLIEAI